MKAVLIIAVMWVKSSYFRVKEQNRQELKLAEITGIKKLKQ